MGMLQPHVHLQGPPAFHSEPDAVLQAIPKVSTMLSGLHLHFLDKPCSHVWLMQYTLVDLHHSTQDLLCMHHMPVREPQQHAGRTILMATW